MLGLVIARDRLSYVQRCTAALGIAGFDVHVVDHGTTYEPLLEWYRESGVPVTMRGDAHPRSVWEWDKLEHLAGRDQYYLVTDPDVVPDEGCPSDWPGHLRGVLERETGWVKAGLSLRIDDLPAHYAHAAQVPRWELQWWQTQVYAGWFNAGVDTTLAIYRPLNQNSRFAIQPALRSTPPYLARHLTWYQNTAAPTPEERHYQAHLPPLISHWADPERYVRGA